MKRYLLNYSLLLVCLLCLASCQSPEAINYYPTGEVERRVPLDEDSLFHGLSVHYYQSGQVQSKIPFQHGLITGRVRRYYPSGALLGVEDMKDNQLHGVVKDFYPTGRLRAVYRQYGNRKVDTLCRYTPDGTLHERVIYSQTGRKLDFDKFDRAGRRDREYTQPLVVTSSDTIPAGVPFLFQVVLANRETNAVTIQFSDMETHVDSVQGQNGQWTYRIAAPREGTNVIQGKVYNHRLSGDTLHHWWYELRHRFYVQAASTKPGTGKDR